MLAAVVAIGGVLTALGGYILKYLIRTSGTLGRIETKLDSYGRDIEALKRWQLDHTAEHVAYRNGYWQARRPLPSWQRDS